MRYRRLGKTELMVSEIGLGAEWLERHNAEECRAVIDRCGEQGINILDCWMPGAQRAEQHRGSHPGKEGALVHPGPPGLHLAERPVCADRDMEKVKEAFADLLERLGTDYIDLGMIHYVDREDELDSIVNGPFYAYTKELKEKGVIRHIGLSTHNPRVAKKAVELGIVEMMLFSINPAFDLLPASEDMNTYFAEEYDQALGGIDKERAELYRLCEKNDVGLTVMKGFAGGRLFDAKRSPFGVALTPVQCIHYALTRPAVASILAGYDTPEHVDEAVSYETATEAEKDYASVLASAPRHAYDGQCTYCGHCKPCPAGIDIAMVNKLYDLASMQPEVPASVRAHYEALERTASDCIGCRGCETRCPFHVPVAERMEKARALFAEGE